MSGPVDGTGPLRGRRVVVTRARGQAGELAGLLRAAGAEVVELPVIEIEPLDPPLPDLRAYTWLVLTSVNGVVALLDRMLPAAGLDGTALAGLRVAAIGPGTAGALGSRGVEVALLPERFVAESLLEAFPPPASPGERVLVVRAEEARAVLPEGLAAGGYRVDVLPVYRTVAGRPDPDAVERVRRGEVDAITFTSSSTVRHFHDLIGDLPEPAPFVASIGPVTSRTAGELGFTVDAEAGEHTLAGLVAALVAGLGGAVDRGRERPRR
ncbi:MAG: uroporphyrinogen-III synthase [Acidimicrobiia bacterium]|nr:uroporphyrinogen-III synthase [Acidimicrobiia bacterium]